MQLEFLILLFKCKENDKEQLMINLKEHRFLQVLGKLALSTNSDIKECLVKIKDISGLSSSQ